MRPKFWTQLETNTIILTVDGNDYPLTCPSAKVLHKDLGRAILLVKPPKHKKPPKPNARPSHLCIPVGGYRGHFLSNVPAKYLLWFEKGKWFQKHCGRSPLNRIADYINFYRAVLEAEVNAHGR